MIRFDSKTEVIISNDLPLDVWTLLEENQSRNVAMIVDTNVTSQQDVQELIAFLHQKVRLRVLEVEAIEPTTGIVNRRVLDFRGDSIDMFIGIGGGSTIDLTKALSVLTVNEGLIEYYHGTGKPFTKGIRKIMIPTTAGTGSEVTPGAVLVNTATKFKRGVSGPFVTPDYAVLCARLTMSMPESVVASTGMDALGHAVESYTAKSANDITQMYSKQAFSLVFKNLIRVFDDPKDITFRKAILLGSCLAGYAIYNSNTGACHAMAYPLGIYHSVPHGVAVAHLLPKVVEINVEKGCNLYADLYDLVTDTPERGDKKSKSEQFCSLFREYLPLRHIKKTFRDYGIDESKVSFLAERGLDLTSALSNNPVAFGLDDAKRVLKSCI